MPDLHIKDLRRNTGALIDRVLGGERFTVYRFDRPVAALVSITDLERLEESMSEDRAPYGLPPVEGDNLSELVNLALFLAHDDQTEAARLLAQAAADLLKAERP
jgi:prevent-host-death family protein